MLQSQYKQDNRNLSSQFRSKVKTVGSQLSSLNIVASNKILNTLQYPTSPPAISAEGYKTQLRLGSQLPPHVGVSTALELLKWP